MSFPEVTEFSNNKNLQKNTYTNAIRETKTDLSVL